MSLRQIVRWGSNYTELNAKETNYYQLFWAESLQHLELSCQYASKEPNKQKNKKRK